MSQQEKFFAQAPKESESKTGGSFAVQVIAVCCVLGIGLYFYEHHKAKEDASKKALRDSNEIVNDSEKRFRDRVGPDYKTSNN